MNLGLMALFIALVDDDSYLLPNLTNVDAICRLMLFVKEERGIKLNKLIVVAQKTHSSALTQIYEYFETDPPLTFL